MPVFSEDSVLSDNEQHSGAENLQWPRNGYAEVDSGQRAQLKSSTSEFDMRKLKEAQRKRNSNRLVKSHSGHDFYETLGNVFEKITHTLRAWKRDELEDLSEEERRIWEQEQLSKEINYSQTTIDPAPFQLVEDTSLYKVHSIFSLLGIRRAYVTKCGVLVGVVAVKEIAAAIEQIQAGTLTSTTKRSAEDRIEETGTTGATSSLPHQQDSDTDTDSEDIILPKVGVEKTAISQILEQKFAALQATSMFDKDRRKSYPSCGEKSSSNRTRRAPRPGRQSCDMLLEKGLAVDEKIVQHVSENVDELCDSQLQHRRQIIPIIIEMGPSSSSSQGTIYSDKRVHTQKAQRNIESSADSLSSNSVHNGSTQLTKGQPEGQVIAPFDKKFESITDSSRHTSDWPINSDPSADHPKQAASSLRYCSDSSDNEQGLIIRINPKSDADDSTAVTTTVIYPSPVQKRSISTNAVDSSVLQSDAYDRSQLSSDRLIYTDENDDNDKFRSSRKPSEV